MIGKWVLPTSLHFCQPKLYTNFFPYSKIKVMVHSLQRENFSIPLKMCHRLPDIRRVGMRKMNAPHPIPSFHSKEHRHIKRQMPDTVLLHHVLWVENIGCTDLVRKLLPEFIQ